MNDHIFRLLNIIQKFDVWPLSIRVKMLRWMGVSIGSGAVVMSSCEFIKGSIHIGRNAFVNQGCLLEGAGGIDIGDEVRIGQRALLVTSTHALGTSCRRAGPLTRAAIVIEAGCWIGASTTILPGSTVGTGAVVGAGSVVLGALPPNGLSVGTPARLCKRY